jgi:hypothetical protein
MLYTGIYLLGTSVNHAGAGLSVLYQGIQFHPLLHSFNKEDLPINHNTLLGFLLCLHSGQNLMYRACTLPLLNTTRLLTVRVTPGGLQEIALE